MRQAADPKHQTPQRQQLQRRNVHSLVEVNEDI